jgi:hypothetical protein
MENQKLDELLRYCQDNNRVCPHEWNDLYNLLITQHKKTKDCEKPLLPLILAAWWCTSNLDKILRLRDQVKWASKYGCLDEVYDFLMGIDETGWHHTYD